MTHKENHGSFFKEFHDQFQFLELENPIQVVYFPFVVLARDYNFFPVC